MLIKIRYDMYLKHKPVIVYNIYAYALAKPCNNNHIVYINILMNRNKIPNR